MKEIRLLTGLSRGNMRAVAGQVVEVEDGLADRLVDRGQAVLVDRVQDVPETRAKKKAAAPVAPAPEIEALDAPVLEVPADPAADTTTAAAVGDAAE